MVCVQALVAAIVVATVVLRAPFWLVADFAVSFVVVNCGGEGRLSELWLFGVWHKVVVSEKSAVVTIVGGVVVR